MKVSNRRSVTAVWVSRLLRDEAGGEAIEYALIIGLVLVTAIAVVGSVGSKVLAR